MECGGFDKQRWQCDVITRTSISNDPMILYIHSYLSWYGKPYIRVEISNYTRTIEWHLLGAKHVHL